MYLILASLLVILGGWLIYKQITRSDAIPTLEPPKLGNEEDRANYAVSITEEALNEARIAEKTQQLNLLASIVSKFEQDLASAQSIAILNPTDVNLSKEASQLEIQAQTARMNLESSWRQALDTATQAMYKAESAAKSALSAYESAKTKIDYWKQQIESANSAIQKYNFLIQKEENLTTRAVYIEKLSYYVKLWNTYRDQLNITIAAVDRIKLEATTAVTNANLTVERVLTITADLRLLGILLDLAFRTDSIAIAIRTKLAEIERRLA